MADKVKYNAYYSLGLCGYEVGVREDGETAHYRFVGMDASESNRRNSKIRWNGKGCHYFQAGGRRIYLDECLRNDLGGGNCA